MTTQTKQTDQADILGGLRLNLQFFASDDGGAAQNSGGDPNGGNTPNGEPSNPPNNQSNNPTKTFTQEDVQIIFKLRGIKKIQIIFVITKKQKDTINWQRKSSREGINQ